MSTFLQGCYIGAMVAFPIGPTVLLLLRIGILRGAYAFTFSAFGAACGVGVAAAVGLFFIRYVQGFLDNYARLTHGTLALMVFLIAIHTFWKNRGLKQSSVHEQRGAVALWVPPMMSLTCPFTSILILNLMSGSQLFSQDLSSQMMALMITGTVIGACLVYTLFMIIVHVLRRSGANRLLFIFLKLSPAIIFYYALCGFWTAYTA